MPGLATAPSGRAELAGAHGWYQLAVFYQLIVRSFADSNDDGIGDLPGLTSKLDYLEWLGVDCLWLPPIYPSPMRDGGYDVADYTDVAPTIGTLHDFATFLDAAHARDIRVVIDFVLNAPAISTRGSSSRATTPPARTEISMSGQSTTPA